MPRDPQYFEKLTFGNTYHVYNRTNNKEDLFVNDDMRFLFIRRMKQYLDGFFTIHAFCLLNNHFHILVSSKRPSQILIHIKEKDKVLLLKSESEFIKMSDNERVANAHDLLNLQFIRLFTSYSLSFNNRFFRSGNLFHRPYKRKLVISDEYFKKVVLYIHKNPLKHKLEEPFDNYYWSSYHEYLNQDEYLSCHQKTLELFRGLNRFIKQHYQIIDYKSVQELLIED